MHLEHHGESRHVTSVLEGGEMWLLSGIAVLYYPHRSDLYLVQEGEVFIGRATPREARVLQGGAYALKMSSSLPSINHDILLRYASFPEATVAGRSMWVLKVNLRS
ncbi:hypothetical protein GWK47_004938 [Chionoecetes opilio]|uniref:Uncharacterized protein n=1 Tax=Chionoecetes opilio TaxID=41210 RepID=A0A8J5CXW1_CHIOP|nr:hypothetical protein GWK47_004938 [Chionoecetes opilio]